MACRRQYVSAIYAILLITGRAAFTSQSSASKDLLICRPVTEVFGTVSQGKADRGLLPFFRGPIGPPGPHGKTGTAGRKGEPKNERVLQIFHENLREMYAELFRLEIQLYRLQGQKSTSDNAKEKECMDKFKAPINVGSMCYAIIGGEGLSWKFEDAKSNCTDLGGYPADLNSREVYEKLYDFVDRSFSTEVEAWTGMKFENEELLLGDGKAANYSKWRYPYPRTSGPYYGSYYKSYVAVTVTLDTSSRIRAIENTRIDRRYKYAVCHFSLDGPLTTSATVTTTEALEYGDTTDDYSYFSS